MTVNNAQLFQLLAAALITVLTPVLTKVRATALTKGGLSAGLVAIAALAAEFFTPGDFDLTSWANRAITVIGPAALFIYRSLVRPQIKSGTGPVGRLAVATKNFGLG